MQSAPSVVYPVGRSAFYGALLLGLAGLMATVGVTWWWFGGPAGWRLPSVLAGAGLVWGGLAGWSWRSLATGRLQWDGQAAGPQEDRPGGWRWWAERAPQGLALSRLEVVFDGQTLALLRLHGPSQVPRWIWVERGRDPARWSDLRRAWAHASR